VSTYALRRLAHTIFVVWAISTVVFVLVNAIGNPVFLMLPEDATKEAVDRLTKEMGLDQPLYVQYVRFLGNAVQGNLGDSFRHREPAIGLVLSYLPATAQLTFVAMAIGVLIAVPLGIIAAVKRNTGLDHAVRIFSLLGQSMPPFWFGIILILVFSVYLRWLPPSGKGTMAHLLLPAFSLGYYSAASVARLMRSAILEVLGTDYVRTARAKGLSEWRVLMKHALRNASIPVVTIMGLEIGRLLGGAIATETIFAWPGIGRLLIRSVSNLDFPVVQSAVLVLAVMLVVVNLMTDLFYATLDPRIRYE
jgi:peptide/nickel transport system permease protein